MPDRCTDLTCQEHWSFLLPALELVRPDFESAAADRALESSSSIYDDLMRAKAAMEAAPPNWSAR